MIVQPTLKEITELIQLHQVQEEIIRVQRMSGTTTGRVFQLESRQGNKYILKYDDPLENQRVQQVLESYESSKLLPKVLFAAQDNTYFAYTYLEGTTHFDRGSKCQWLTLLVKDLYNAYIRYTDQHHFWGRMEHPTQTWREFNAISIEEAKVNIGRRLSEEDDHLLQAIVDQCYHDEPGVDERFLLHGDMGVHNFIYHQHALVGVIDPSPMVGPITYDFLYAFCSSPDDLNFDTLWSAYSHLEQGRVSKSRLIKEVLIHLYCRIGLCIKHHPEDLPAYLNAWAEWKQICK